MTAELQKYTVLLKNYDRGDDYYSWHHVEATDPHDAVIRAAMQYDDDRHDGAGEGSNEGVPCSYEEALTIVHTSDGCPFEIMCLPGHLESLPVYKELKEHNLWSKRYEILTNAEKAKKAAEGLENLLGPLRHIKGVAMPEDLMRSLNGCLAVQAELERQLSEVNAEIDRINQCCAEQSRLRAEIRERRETEIKELQETLQKAANVAACEKAVDELTAQRVLAR